MNWDQVEGKWKQLKGSAKQQWAKFTDDDLDYIAGKRESLIGKLQERYGIARDEAQRKADEWLRAQEAGIPAGTQEREAHHAGRR
jgi:uncharacterized protein YjbJ (UPF0337 family)